MNVHEKINFREACRRSRTVEYPLASAPYIPTDRPANSRKAPRVIAYNPEHESFGGKARWIENVSRGLRVMGLAHEVNKRAVGHTGWYTDSECINETMAGIVVRLPARKGRNRYLVGYADPHNEDCALLDMSLIEADRKHSGESEDTAELARAADSVARVHADRERDYQDAWRELVDARQRMAEARESVLEHIETVRGYRDAAMANPDQYESAMTDLDSAWSDYREATNKAFEVADNAQRQGISWGDCAP